MHNFFLISCGEEQKEKAESEKIKKDYPALEGKLPFFLARGTIVTEGFCQELYNTQVFTFTHPKIMFERYDVFLKDKDIIFGTNAEVQFELNSFDTYDRNSAPTECETEERTDLRKTNYYKGPAFCTRTIIGYDDNGHEVKLTRQEQATCEFRVISRSDCIPDMHFSDGDKLLFSPKSACSSEKFDVFRLETKRLWQEKKSERAND